MAPKSSKEFDNISKHFFNFLLVRHPFTRLVSAYKDRIARCKMKQNGTTQVNLLSFLIFFY